MTRTAHRRAAAVLTAALALGVAGPAGARPFDINSSGSFVPVNITQPQAVGGHAAVTHANGNSDLEYALIGVGVGGAAVAMLGLGGTRLAGRRRRQTAATARPTIPA